MEKVKGKEEVMRVRAKVSVRVRVKVRGKEKVRGVRLEARAEAGPSATRPSLGPAHKRRPWCGA